MDFRTGTVADVVEIGAHVSIPTEAGNQHNGIVTHVARRDNGTMLVTLRYWSGGTATIRTRGTYRGAHEIIGGDDFAPVEIRTSYAGPTDTRGARIVATGGGHRLTVPYDYAARDPHAHAAHALAGVLIGNDASLRLAGTGTTGNRYVAR